MKALRKALHSGTPLDEQAAPIQPAPSLVPCTVLSSPDRHLVVFFTDAPNSPADTHISLQRRFFSLSVAIHCDQQPQNPYFARPHKLLLPRNPKLARSSLHHMDLQLLPLRRRLRSSPAYALALFLLIVSRGASGATFTFVNRCQYTVWPGILANAGSPSLDSTGFELPSDSSRTFQAPTGWSGRFWGRTSCSFDGSLSGSCLTGDCGSGQLECNGLGAAPPATLAEFTLGSGGQDFYDVSLVDGYNLPMLIEGSGGSGACASTGCSADLNQQCPAELRVGEGDACKSACEAFGSPEYCCSGAYNSPVTCRPTVYSEMFKSACPRSYSYAYDDATSTFTCTGADYTVTFCPSSTSQKTARDSTPTAAATTTTTTPAQGSGSELGSGTGTGYSGTGTGSMSGSGQAVLADGSWMAGLAMGDSPRIASPCALQSTAAVCLCFLFLMLSPFHL